MMERVAASMVRIDARLDQVRRDSRLDRSAKRTLDVLLSGMGLFASMPIWVALAAVIKLEDGGDVFYHQERVGQGGAFFRVFKFRSMIQNAEAVVGALQ